MPHRADLFVLPDFQLLDLAGDRGFGDLERRRRRVMPEPGVAPAARHRAPGRRQAP